MGVSFNPEFSDVLNDGYVTNSVNVTTSPVEAKAGGSRLSGRECVTIENTGNKTLYYGPTGVTASTGAPLFKGQFVSLPIGENIGVFLICGIGDSTTAIVQEMA